jgi:ribose-phosphate pyrophosphokinase
MIATGGTLAESLDALLAAGARPEVTIAATHGLFVAGARARLTHPAVGGILVTDTTPVSATGWSTLEVVTVAPLLAAALQRFLVDGSVGGGDG